MATFNAELAHKAMDRRITGLENMVDAAQKQSRSSGDLPSNVAALQKQLAEQKQRIDNLEKLVKTLMETRGESKGVALDKLQQSLQEIEKQQRKDRENIFKEIDAQRDKQQKAQIGDIVRRPDVKQLIDQELARTRKEMSTVADASRKQAELAQDRAVQAAVAAEKRERDAALEKMQKEIARVNQENATRMIKDAIDTQLKVLTARLTAVEAAAKR